MPKRISFTDNDKELIWQIEKFRETQKLPSFTEAVRRLCKYGLSMSDVAKDLK